MGAMLLEVVLLIVRDQKQQLHDARKRALAGEGPASLPTSRLAASAVFDDGVAVMSGATEPSTSTAATAASSSAVDASSKSDSTLHKRSGKSSTPSGAAAPPPSFAPFSFGARDAKPKAA